MDLLHKRMCLEGLIEIGLQKACAEIGIIPCKCSWEMSEKEFRAAADTIHYCLGPYIESAIKVYEEFLQSCNEDHTAEGGATWLKKK